MSTFPQPSDHLTITITTEDLVGLVHSAQGLDGIVDWGHIWHWFHQVKFQTTLHQFNDARMATEEETGVWLDGPALGVFVKHLDHIRERYTEDRLL